MRQTALIASVYGFTQRAPTDNSFPSVISRGPVPVSVRSKAWVCGRSLAEIVGSNPAGGKDVCGECCVWSGRGLCVGLITCTGESYRV